MITVLVTVGTVNTVLERIWGLIYKQTCHQFCRKLCMSKTVLSLWKVRTFSCEVCRVTAGVTVVNFDIMNAVRQQDTQLQFFVNQLFSPMNNTSCMASVSSTITLISPSKVWFCLLVRHWLNFYSPALYEEVTRQVLRLSWLEIYGSQVLKSQTGFLEQSCFFCSSSFVNSNVSTKFKMIKIKFKC